jgi:hypothetical protein
VAEACDLIFRPDAERGKLFWRNDGGKVDAWIDRFNDEDGMGKKVR